MTLKELVDKSCSFIYVKDGKNHLPVDVWSMLYDLLGDCMIDEIEIMQDGSELEVTLKTQLVRKDG